MKFSNNTDPFEFHSIGGYIKCVLSKELKSIKADPTLTSVRCYIKIPTAVL